MLTIILILQLLTGSGHHAKTGDPGFLGFHLGMKAPAALRQEGKNPGALEHVKAHSGQRVISDTVPVTDCKLTMRRSLGFDSAGMLTAVGLTYKTTPDRIKEARDCAYQWLSNTYGHSTDEAVRDSTKQVVWKLGSAQITLEAKGYNEKDFFVLIYYYKAGDTPQ